MSAIDYAQILSAADSGQSADDDVRWYATPVPIRSGRFRIYYKPRHNSRVDGGAEGDRYLLSVKTAAGHLGFYLQTGGADTILTRIHVTLDGVDLVDQRIIEFEPGDTLSFLFDATTGQATISGARSGDGTTDPGTPWSIADGEMRLGGNVEGGGAARGHVSLPYAASGAEDPAGQLQFSGLEPLEIFAEDLVEFSLSSFGIVTEPISGHVAQWLDETANDNDVTDSTSTNRPAYAAAGGINDLPYLEFTATNTERLVRDTGFSGFEVGDGAYVWAIVRPTVAGALWILDWEVMGGVSGQTGIAISMSADNKVRAGFYLGSGINFVLTPDVEPAVTLDQDIIVEAWIDPEDGTIKCAVNCGTPASQAVADTTLGHPIDRISVACRSGVDGTFFGGRFYEFGASKVYSVAKQQLMRTRFRARYNLPPPPGASGIGQLDFEDPDQSALQRNIFGL